MTVGSTFVYGITPSAASLGVPVTRSLRLEVNRETRTLRRTFCQPFILRDVGSSDDDDVSDTAEMLGTIRRACAWAAWATWAMECAVLPRFRQRDSPTWVDAVRQEGDEGVRRCEKV